MAPKIETLRRDHRVLAAFDSGRTVAQIAAAEKLTTTHVRRILQSHGLRSPGARPDPAPAVVARLADTSWLKAEYAAKNVPQNAHEVGATVGQVVGALRRAGIPRRGVRAARALALGMEWTHARAAHIVALYCGGLAAKAVAEEVGISEAAVVRLLQAQGVMRTPRAARLLYLAQQRARS